MSNLAGLTQALMQGNQQSQMARLAAMQQPRMPQIGGGWEGAQLGAQLAQRKQVAQMQQQAAGQRQMQQMLMQATQQQAQMRQRAMIEKTRQAEAAQRFAMQQERMALSRAAGEREDTAFTADEEHRDWLRKQAKGAPKDPREIRNAWTDEQWIEEGIRLLGLERVASGEYTPEHVALGEEVKTTYMSGGTINERGLKGSNAYATLTAAEEATPTPETVAGQVDQTTRIAQAMPAMTPGEVLMLMQSIRKDAKTPAGGDELVRLAQGYDIGDYPITVQTKEELDEIFEIRKAAGVDEIERIRGLSGPPVDEWRRARILRRKRLDVDVEKPRRTPY